ncbi:hypothetical protein SFRURICE_002045 [Spodoptera frugiperda]|nr:hypothetical protein SFRURICE_002045 [Spodoptera frugiperda]
MEKEIHLASKNFLLCRGVSCVWITERVFPCGNQTLYTLRCSWLPNHCATQAVVVAYMKIFICRGCVYKHTMSHIHNAQTRNDNLWITLQCCSVRESDPLHVARQPVVKPPHQPCKPKQQFVDHTKRFSVRELNLLHVARQPVAQPPRQPCSQSVPHTRLKISQCECLLLRTFYFVMCHFNYYYEQTIRTSRHR